MPQLLIFQNLTGLPYGRCSECKQTFELAWIGTESENVHELEGKFLAHLELEHRDVPANGRMVLSNSRGFTDKGGDSPTEFSGACRRL